MIRTGYTAWYDGGKTYYVVRRRWLHDDATITLQGTVELRTAYWLWDEVKLVADVKTPDGVPVTNRAVLRAVIKAHQRFHANLAKTKQLEARKREADAWVPTDPTLPTAMVVYRPSGTFAALVALFRRLYLPPRCSPPRPRPEKTP